jgi:hypothetical protein
MPPPRRVVFSLVVANMFNGIGQIGWDVFGFGMIFVMQRALARSEACIVVEQQNRGMEGPRTSQVFC